MDQLDLVSALVRRGRLLAAEMKSMSEEHKKIIARLDELVPVGWKLDVDGIPASKRTGNRSFSPALAISHFTAEEKAACVKTVVDPKEVRSIAEARNLVEACMVEPDGDKAILKLA